MDKWMILFLVAVTIAVILLTVIGYMRHRQHRHTWQIKREGIWRIRDYNENGWTSRHCYERESGKECAPITKVTRYCTCGKTSSKIDEGHTLVLPVLPNKE